VYDEMLLTVNADKATPVDRVDLSDLDLREREHLQEWILANPAVLGPNVEIIASEYGRWQTAGGVPVLDRLDILAVDPDGRLVVAELKRGRGTAHGSHAGHQLCGDGQQANSR
jgi:RecB family endonuclease NucS